MHVGDNRQPTRLAEIPQRAEVATIKTNDAGVQAVRVEVVVQNEIDNPSPPIIPPAQEEGSALA
jgi:hypothetical protein